MEISYFYSCFCLFPVNEYHLDTVSFLKDLLILLYVHEYFACVHIYVHHVQAWCHGSPGTGVKSCELPCGCCVLNLSPLEEQPELLME